MRVLIVHSRYLSAESGENQVVDDEARVLRESGHKVWVYAPTTRAAGTVDRLRAGGSAVWSISAADAVARAVREHGVDVVHVHNLFPNLSPAVLRAGDAAGATVVVTLHNYRLMCLPANLLRNGRVCELCVGHLPWRGVVLGCYRESVLGSAAIASSLVLHRAIGSFDAVTRFLAVSDFVKSKYVEAGIPAERIGVKPNFTWPVSRRKGPGDYFLFVGRLSPEKGLMTLLDAWRERSPGTLIVAGDGPLANELRREAPSNVEFLGSVPHAEVPSLLASARALVVPSRCYEAAPKAIIEAFAAGVPVIAARIGGLEGIVQDGTCGVHVANDRPTAWLSATEQLLDDRESERLGEAAFRTWQGLYSPAVGLRRLEAAYRGAVAARYGQPLIDGPRYDPQSPPHPPDDLKWTNKQR
jgi:glycosyltransferase involved in cell wall biosynthesis